MTRIEELRKDALMTRRGRQVEAGIERKGGRKEEACVKQMEARRSEMLCWQIED